MTVVLDRKPKAERSLTEIDAHATAEAAAPEFDLMDENSRRWRPAGDGLLWEVSPGGRVDRLVTVPLAAVEMLCGPLRQVKAVTR